MSDVTVVTTIFGGRDQLREPAVHFRGLNLVCFTDDARVRSNHWDVRVVERQGDARRAARKVKTLIHEHVTTDWTVWLDASFWLVGDVTALCKPGIELAAFVHPWRKCIYEEAEACIALKRDDAKLLAAQAAHYREAGYPSNAGLFAGGLVARHMSADMVKLGEAWWDEIQGHSSRDQISLPFVLRKLGMQCTPLQGNVYKNQYAEWYGHST